MARYTGADCRRCRREKMKLFLKGSKCDGPKCPFESRPFPPGQHGRGRLKETEYLLQLREKQKARRVYGVLEKQFRRYYEEAVAKQGKTGEVLLQILESRLDNVVYRAGYAKSRDMARQVVKHGHITVNGRKVDIPSYRVSEHDIVQVREKSRELTPFVDRGRRGRFEDRAGVARGDPDPDEGPGAQPAVARQHRHAGAGATYRRALLEVGFGIVSRLAGGVAPTLCARRTRRRVRLASEADPVPNRVGQRSGQARQNEVSDGHQIAGAPNEKRSSAYLSASVSHRRVDQRHSFPVHHRAARAGLRLHARQLAAAYAAQLDPGRGGHVDQGRRRAARVHDDPRRQGGRGRAGHERQGAVRQLRARRAGQHVPAQAGPR